MSAYQNLIKRWLGTFLGMLLNAPRTAATVGRWKEGGGAAGRNTTHTQSSLCITWVYCNIDIMMPPGKVVTDRGRSTRITKQPESESRPPSLVESRPTFSGAPALRCHYVSGQTRFPRNPKEIRYPNELCVSVIFGQLHGITSGWDFMMHRRRRRQSSITLRQQEMLRRGWKNQEGLIWSQPHAHTAEKSAWKN